MQKITIVVKCANVYVRNGGIAETSFIETIVTNLKDRQRTGGTPAIVVLARSSNSPGSGGLCCLGRIPQ